ncbi:MAG: prepilin peptidase, partial [Nitrospira sp.]|nr:prepilin peptidase [Nitrospira sp.]
MIPLHLIVGIFGAIVGSFLNVCIYRLPRRESVAWPGSHCPACSHPIAWYDNIPIVSYLVLMGRCRSCTNKIPWRYPMV